jgi:hypothetical protein
MASDRLALAIADSGYLDRRDMELPCGGRDGFEGLACIEAKNGFPAVLNVPVPDFLAGLDGV